MTDTTTAANTFLQTYFTTFDTLSRQTLSSFYHASSRLTFEDATYIGASDILKFMVEAPKVLRHHRGKTVVEPIGDTGKILVLVTGLLEFGGRGTVTKFATTFVLAEREKEGVGERFVIDSQISSISFEGNEELDREE